MSGPSAKEKSNRSTAKSAVATTSIDCGAEAWLAGATAMDGQFCG